MENGSKNRYRLLEAWMNMFLSEDTMFQFVWKWNSGFYEDTCGELGHGSPPALSSDVADI